MWNIVNKVKVWLALCNYKEKVIAILKNVTFINERAGNLRYQRHINPGASPARRSRTEAAAANRRSFSSEQSHKRRAAETKSFGASGSLRGEKRKPGDGESKRRILGASSKRRQGEISRAWRGEGRGRRVAGQPPASRLRGRSARFCRPRPNTLHPVPDINKCFNLKCVCVDRMESARRRSARRTERAVSGVGGWGGVGVEWECGPGGGGWPLSPGTEVGGGRGCA